LRATEKEWGDLRRSNRRCWSTFSFLSLVKAWDDMVGLAQRMPQVLAGTVMIQEQLGFALNGWGAARRRRRSSQPHRQARPGQRDYGLLGRVYKDRWRPPPRPANP